jgi:hypothetical protein
MSEITLSIPDESTLALKLTPEAMGMELRGNEDVHIGGSPGIRPSQYPGLRR